MRSSEALCYLHDVSLSSAYSLPEASSFNAHRVEITNFYIAHSSFECSFATLEIVVTTANQDSRTSGIITNPVDQ